MDLRTLTKLILKLAGLYVLSTALFSIPSIVVAPPGYAGAAVVSFGIYSVVGLALFWFPGTVANQIIRVPGSELDGVPTAAAILRVGLMLLGCYFAVTALYGLVYTWGKARLFYLGTHGPEFSPDDQAFFLASGLQVALGLLLWFGSRFIIRVAGGFEARR